MTGEGSGLTDESVAAYLGLTAAHVRVMRMMMDIRACPSCRRVHPTYPSIRFFHSPVCDQQGRCRLCQAPIDVGMGHEVGLICQKCYDDGVVHDERDHAGLAEGRRAHGEAEPDPER
jgi:hypothetical protein